MENPEYFNKKIEEINEESPIAKGEVFDPEKELGKIKKLPHGEKSAKIAEFREKLAFQKEGIGELQEVLEKAIRQNPDAPFAKLCESVELMAPQWGLTNWQKELAKRALTKYVEKHNVVRLLREKYADDGELYEAFFGRKPRGKLKVFLGPMNIFFQTEDIRDFAFVMQGIFLNKKDRVSKNDIEESFNYGGCLAQDALVSEFPASISTVIILNDRVKIKHKNVFNKINTEQVIEHEERHALDYMLDETINDRNEYNVHKLTEKEKELLKDVGIFFDRGDLRGMEISFVRFFFETRKEFEEMAKNEITAYFKNGELGENIIFLLTKPFNEGGVYDYYARAKKVVNSKFDSSLLIKNFGAKFAPMIKKIAKQVFVEDYNKLLEESVDAMFDLQIEGYSNEKIIGLLSTEPLRKWRKVVDRLLAAENMKEETE